jgi:predicted XRE-type DNA-binding protein
MPVTARRGVEPQSPAIASPNFVNPESLVSRESKPEHIRLRLELMDAVQQVLRRRRLRQRDAAALFGVAQPRVSDLVRGKVALFSIDTLVDMLGVLGIAVKLEIRTDRAARTAPPAVPSRTSSPSGPERNEARTGNSE